MRRASLALLASLLGVLALAGGPPPAPPRPEPAPRTLRIAAVQMRSTRDLAANAARVNDWLRKCAADGAQVAVFPECALSGYFDDVVKGLTAEQLAEAERAVGRACAEHKIA